MAPTASTIRPAGRSHAASSHAACEGGRVVGSSTRRMAAPYGAVKPPRRWLHAVMFRGNDADGPLVTDPPIVRHRRQQGAAHRAVQQQGHMQQQPVIASSIDGSENGSRGVNLSGTWAKDLQASQAEEYDKALELWGIGGVQKATARLIQGLEIDHQDGRFAVSFVTPVPTRFFNVREEYSLRGAVTSLMRRDLRRGAAAATAEETLRGVRVTQRWPHPYAGSMVEEYVCPDPSDAGRMLVVCSLTIGERTITNTQQYRRQSGGRDALLRDSEERHGSVGSMFKRMGVGIPFGLF